jgi:predicted AAA+ superfamily ATPase
MKTGTLYRWDIVSELGKYLYTDDIVVLHGARQVGKTSILRYLEDRLRHKGEKTRYIDLEDSRYATILDAGVDGLLGLLTEDGLYVPGNKKDELKTLFREYTLCGGYPWIVLTPERQTATARP